MKGQWVPPDIRDEVVDYVRDWSAKTELPQNRLITWLGVGRSKFFDWRTRFGKVNEHNAWVPRDHWLMPEERQTILDYYAKYSREGYRRLAIMMLDADLVAVSPSSVYRVLKKADLLRRGGAPSRKGTGFEQPLRAHEHWHVDVSYVNIRGTFYFLCCVLDGYSRMIVSWDVRETMKEAEVEVIVQRAREAYPGVTPRIISDNGPQFVAKEFKAFVRTSGMTHVRTSPYYPQSNGKIERFHQSIKSECIRPKPALSLDNAKRSIAEYVKHYNEVRLHGAIGYVAPADKLAGRADEIFAARDRKLAAARARRAASRQVRSADPTAEDSATHQPCLTQGCFAPNILHPTC